MRLLLFWRFVEESADFILADFDKGFSDAFSFVGFEIFGTVVAVSVVSVVVFVVLVDAADGGVLVGDVHFALSLVAVSIDAFDDFDDFDEDGEDGEDIIFFFLQQRFLHLEIHFFRVETK